MHPAAPPFDPAFCDTVLALGRQGKGEAAFAAELGVDAATLQAWREAHEGFDFAVSAAITASRAWWDELPREAVNKDGMFRPVVWARVIVHVRAGKPPGGDAGEPPRGDADEPPPLIPLAAYDIPDNGKTAKSRRRRRKG